MKKYFSLLFFLLLLSTSSALYDKKIYDGWIKSGYPINISNETYTVQYVKQTNTTVIYFPNNVTAAIFPTNSSKCTKEWIYSVCQTKQKFERGKYEVPPDINDPNVNTSLYLQINTSDIKINFTRSLSKKEGYVGDSIDFTVLLEKYDLFDVFNATFNDTIPEGLELTDVKWCEKTGNTVLWKGDLNFEEKVSCTYTVKALKPGTYVLKARSTYVIYGRERTEANEQKIIVKDLPLSFNFTLGQLSAIINTSVNSTVTISAADNITIDELTFAFPDSFEAVNYTPNLRHKDSGLSAGSIFVKKGNTTKFFFKVKNTLQGLFQINATLFYTYNGIKNTIKKEVTVRYNSTSPEIGIFDKGNLSLIRIYNFYPQRFRDIKLSIDNRTQLDIGALEPGTHKEADYEKLNNSKHRAKITYRTEFGQILEKEYTLGYGEISVLIKNTTLAKDIARQVKPQAAPQQNKKLEIDYRVVWYAAIIAVTLFIVFFIIKSFSKKPSLDKEIEKIKKEAENKK